MPEVASEAEVMTDEFDDAVERLIARMAPEGRDSVRNDIGGLRNRGVSSWPDLVAVMNDRSAAGDRGTACWLLGRLGDERALGPLIAALHDLDPALRAESARALGALDSPQAVPGLIAALQTDADVDTRAAAAYALGLLGDPRAIEPLLAKLADTSEDPGVRGFAAEAFTWHGEHRAVPALIAALSDPSAEVRFWAAFALGELADPSALGELERLAHADTEAVPGWGRVKDEAATAIENIRTPSSCGLPAGEVACQDGQP
jgi:HEAT repeat protein